MNEGNSYEFRFLISTCCVVQALFSAIKKAAPIVPLERLYAVYVLFVMPFALNYFNFIIVNSKYQPVSVINPLTIETGKIMG